MARRLAACGVCSDAFDGRSLFENIERLDVLPEAGSAPSAEQSPKTTDYQTILIVGPWQNPRTILLMIRQWRKQLIIYMPRGGLADNEFFGARNFKKKLYFKLIESYIAKIARVIVFSSKLEVQHSSRLTRFANKHVVIPDIFEPPATELMSHLPSCRLSFLAEFDPRKGALEFVEGLRAWINLRTPSVVPFEIVIGGGPRRGREQYYKDVCAKASSVDGANIRFIGPVTHQDRADFYAACDIFMVSSKFESYCLTALEALASGCVLICAPDVGVLEYLPDHPAIVRLSGLSPTDISGGLERAYRWHMNSGERRINICAMAAQAIADINDPAVAAWRELLQGPVNTNAIPALHL